MKSASYTIQGHRVVEITRNCIKKSLTEEVVDVALESVTDFLSDVDPRDTRTLAYTQSTLVDYFKYYVSETIGDQATHFSVVGDSRNNTQDDYGKRFFVEIAFTVKQSLIATKISYMIEYKNS